jgi:hypothetical protein
MHCIRIQWLIVCRCQNFPPPTLAELRALWAARPDDPDMRCVLLEVQHARLALLDIIALANDIEDIASTHDYQVNAKRYQPRRALLARLREEIKRVGPVIDSPVSHAEKQFFAHQRRLQQDQKKPNAPGTAESDRDSVFEMRSIRNALPLCRYDKK